MNRRTLLIGASALGLAAFGSGAFVLNRRRQTEADAAAAAAPAADDGRHPGQHARVDSVGPGAQTTRLPVRRADHWICVDAGHRDGRRPRRELLGSGRSGLLARGSLHTQVAR